MGGVGRRERRGGRKKLLAGDNSWASDGGAPAKRRVDNSRYSSNTLSKWKNDANLREIKVMRRYHIQDREDYHKYNKLCGQLRSFAHRISLLPAQDPFRTKMEGQLLSKLYDMGILNTAAKLSDVENKVTVAAFCRRRLAVFMCMSKMAETVSAAVKFIEQGHVRVGPDTITDPAFLVNRHMEDYVTWVDTSKLKRTIMEYNDELDDFDLL
ncbi:U3 small nucleolar ribonucleoprotein IMP3 [Coprinopsis cinerea okayama7|uniref:U3 small nucleolar ribonucleoprotein protein IMP3 n=1 Tax=Coprinopsis cinerea (strain Okayama-7 / 130 / ATCC MYA-4618 / FGSC 9003) TaxID=240176 RepID=A8PGH8_COPC7|nr:U3 small nucleolar ribonucleoprotein IMP3 [Coprinopsis cinerea okayama7\|eukprot:XP_001841221.2 U3 small nucleolar ribonucleoprotein IMP3 [Coprinopsis cinerea okayama7\